MPSTTNLFPPKKTGLSPTRMEPAARMFRALGEVSRLQILSALMDGEKSVGQLVADTSLGQANVSKQLAALHAQHLVDRRRRGNFILYSIADPMLYALCDLVCGKIGHDAKARARALR